MADASGPATIHVWEKYSIYIFLLAFAAFLGVAVLKKFIL